MRRGIWACGGLALRPNVGTDPSQENAPTRNGRLVLGWGDWARVVPACPESGGFGDFVTQPETRRAQRIAQYGPLKDCWSHLLAGVAMR